MSVQLLQVSHCNVLLDSKNSGKCVMIQYLSDPACAQVVHLHYLSKAYNRYTILLPIADHTAHA